MYGTSYRLIIILCINFVASTFNLCSQIAEGFTVYECTNLPGTHITAQSFPESLQFLTTGGTEILRTERSSPSPDLS